jgi:predicted nucleic acid-binding protein
LIDSWSWIEYYQGSKAGASGKRYIEGKEMAVISAINIAEVYRWFLRNQGEKAAKEELNTMKARSLVIAVTEEIAVKAAEIRDERGLGLGDSLILATARVTDAEVLTGDPDFRDLDEAIFIGD